MPQNVIPEARGKAAARSAFFNSGGGMVGRGQDRDPSQKFQKGPLRGKTLSEAENEFNNRWEGATPGQKDKYARRESVEGSLAPSEIAALNQTQSQAPARPSFPAQRVSPAAVSAPRSTGVPRGTPQIVGSTPAPPPVSGKAASDAAYGAIADRRKASGYDPSSQAQDTDPAAKAASDASYAGIAAQRAASGYNPATAAADTALGGKRINPLTGVPFGWSPGDPLPAGAARLQDENNTAVNPPTAVKPREITGPMGITQQDNDAAVARRNSPGGTVESDREDFATNTNFRKQQEAAQDQVNRVAERSGRMQAGRMTDGRGNIVASPVAGVPQSTSPLPGSVPVRIGQRSKPPIF